MSDPEMSDDRPMTAPPFQISVLDMEEEAGRELAERVGAYVNALSRYINLERLDGITISTDHAGALTNLDRGYDTSFRLAPSSEMAIGVAMTPMVSRGGIIKSHMLFDANYIYPLGDFEHDDHERAMQLLAHECAHVELNMVYDRTFPNTLLQTAYDNVLEHIRGSTEMACWDEYAACRIAAPFGRDPMEDYIETFLAHLSQTEDRANACIREYRLHADHSRVLREVSGYYGNLLKSISYLLGHLDGSERDLSVVPAANETLTDHWVAPYVERLHATLRQLWQRYGEWQHEDFDPIGDIVVEILNKGGIEIYEAENGEIGFHAPFTWATMP